MAYASLSDLVAAFGEAELVRLTTPVGQPLGEVQPARAGRALDEASELMDSYIRRRYAVPVQASGALRSCCCALARFDLAHSGDSQPSDQMTAARKERIAWLDAIAAGRVQLDAAEQLAPQSLARVTDRARTLQPGDML